MNINGSVRQINNQEKNWVFDKINNNEIKEMEIDNNNNFKDVVLKNKIE